MSHFHANYRSSEAGWNPENIGNGTENEVNDSVASHILDKIREGFTVKSETHCADAFFGERDRGTARESYFTILIWECHCQTFESQ